MTEERNKLASLFAECAKDDALKARFISDPRAVLAEFGMECPDGIDLKIVENTDNCVHITLPAAPANTKELSDEELSQAAGGMSHLGVCSNQAACSEAPCTHHNTRFLHHCPC